MTDIVTLWRAGQLPIEDGVFYADGRSYAVDVVDGDLVVAEEFDLGLLLAEDPDWLTTIDITREAGASPGSVCGGEGSHGSEGFFARLNADGGLVWVCYLSEANPVDTLVVSNGKLTVTTTSGVSITVDVDDPVG